MTDKNANLKLNLQVDASALQRAAASLKSIAEQFGKPIRLQLAAPQAPAASAQGGLRPNADLDEIFAPIPQHIVDAERERATLNRRMRGAVNWHNASFEGHVQHLERLQVALHPEILQRQVALKNELKVAQLALNEALKKEQDLQGYVAEKAITDEDRRLKALQRVNAELERRKQKEVDDKAGYVAEKAVSGIDRYVAALKKVNLALEQQKQRLTDLDLQSRPDVLRRRVENDLKIEEKQRGLRFAESAERTKQLGTGRGLLDLFNIPDLSKQFANIGGKMSGLGELLSNPFSKAGGMLSSLGLGSLGAGVGGLLGKAGAALAIPGVGQIAALAAVGLPMITNGIKALAAAPFAAVNAGLKGLLGPLGPLGSALSIGTGLLDGFAGALKKIPIVGSILAAYPEMLSTALKQLGAFLQTAVALTAKARPGEIKRLQFALDDTAAVVGHRLTPVVELLRTVIRGLGDLFQTVLPSTQSFREALAPLGAAFNEVKLAITPVAYSLRVTLVGALKVVGLAIQTFMAMPGIGMLINLGANLARLSGQSPESSVGAAARQVQITNPQDYAKQVYAAAAASGADPVRRTAENTGQMLRVLQDIRDRIFVLRAVQTAAGAITGGAVSAAPTTARAVEAARRRWLGLGSI